MKHIKPYFVFSILVMFLGILCILPANSLLMTNFVIKSHGAISTGQYARSGSAEDIQTAVDWVAANLGIGNVYIPAGTFDFVEVGEPWMTVQIPAGINIFGEETEKDTDGQVIGWETVLVMPYEVAEGTNTAFFRITGNKDPNKPSRFSDIKLVGYREIDSNSVTRYDGVDISKVADFRVDHCYFRNVAGQGVGVSDSYGVIDHCQFVNSYGYVTDAWADCTVWYGVNVARGYGVEDWETDSSKVLGHYTDYTVFIEDCYFEKWRHCVAANFGAHVVFRYNTVNEDYGYGSLDAHGSATISNGQVIRGTRAYEIYGNQMLNPVQYRDSIWLRGGAGIVFNNIVNGYNLFLYLSQEASDDVPECQIHDVYVWGNTLNGATEVSVWYGDKNPIEEGIDYFRHAPQTFNYEPYPYPHPLTLEAAP